MLTTKKQAGFTIIELLIVIIVIAILATLVITTYNGVQHKAENSKTISAVRAYKKALILYAIEHGKYPPTKPDGTWYRACLGEDYSGDDCGDGFFHEIADFNDQLRPYMGGGKLPMPSTQPLFLNVSVVGAFFWYKSDYTVDGESHPFWLRYWLYGHNQKCPVGPVASGAPNFSSHPPGGYTASQGTTTNCSVYLPNPNTL